MIIIFNLIALGICGIAFGVALVVGHWFNLSGEAALAMVAAPVATGLDLLYRGRTARWFHPRGGGALFFVPVWFFGIVWLVVGAAIVLGPNGKFPKAAPRLAASAHTSVSPARITSEAAGRSEALKMYPSLGVTNSPLNAEFVLRYKQYQREKPQFFRDPSWPVALANECATALGVQQSPHGK